jgi:predicted NAD/FAD-dependent oxidoreductase
MIKKGLIGLWNARFVEIENRKITKKRQWGKDYNHYVGVPNMNAIAKYLSQDIQVKLVTCIKYIRKQNYKWILENDQGDALGEFDWVISIVRLKSYTLFIAIIFKSKFSEDEKLLFIDVWFSKFLSD